VYGAMSIHVAPFKQAFPLTQVKVPTLAKQSNSC